MVFCVWHQRVLLFAVSHQPLARKKKKYGLRFVIVCGGFGISVSYDARFFIEASHQKPTDVRFIYNFSIDLVDGCWRLSTNL
jgi:hypothetical protein